MTYLKYGRLDALANLVPDINVSGHFGQDIGPEGWLLRSSPAEGWRVPGCVLQLHATQQSMSARMLSELTASRPFFSPAPAARAGGGGSRTHCWRSCRSDVSLMEGTILEPGGG